MIDLRAHPECLWRPEYHSDIHWWHGHIPFAFYVMAVARPRRFVELGTHKGDSYMAFCQAVSGLGLSTECVAVDGWIGDEHVGELDETVYETLKEVHDSRYGSFSRLHRAMFDEAAAEFADGSIDLLHIDGTHTYEAVARDVELWLPNLSDRGVLLMHDVGVRKWDYGVWEVWAEIEKQYPTIEFTHSAGLGVARIGSQVPGEIAELFDASADEKSLLIRLFAALGNQLIWELDGSQRLDQHLRLRQGT